MTIVDAFVVAFTQEHLLLLQTLPLNDEQLDPWARRVEAEGAILAAGDPPMTITLQLDVDDDANPASIDSLVIEYRDSTGQDFVQTTNQGLLFRPTC